jgi:hypothetical protein
MNNINFIEFLQNVKDESELRKYILENGKEGKSFCPIMFLKEEEKDNDYKIDN